MVLTFASNVEFLLDALSSIKLNGDLNILILF